MKKININNQERIFGKNIVKIKRKGYFRNIEEVKVIKIIANMGQEISGSKSRSKVWVAYNPMLK
ncbi:MAG: hypothetical protein MGF17_06860 [Trichodesmium sp. MAG_R04]|nr:hypothetical protein [Trichodesmium sp. MAG_R04]